MGIFSEYANKVHSFAQIDNVRSESDYLIELFWQSDNPTALGSPLVRIVISVQLE